MNIVLKPCFVYGDFNCIFFSHLCHCFLTFVYFYGCQSLYAFRFFLLRFPGLRTTPSCPVSRSARLLLYRDNLRQISRLIHIQSFIQRHIVGNQLQHNGSRHYHKRVRHLRKPVDAAPLPALVQGFVFLD